MIHTRIGKLVTNVDKEFNRKFEGIVLEEIKVIDNDPKTNKPRYAKFLEIIEWQKPNAFKGKQEVRFAYWDRDDFQRRPLMLPLKLFEEMLNIAVKKGILKIEHDRIHVQRVKSIS